MPRTNLPKLQNLIPDSEDLTTSTWSRNNLITSASVVIAPDGVSTSTNIITTSTAANSLLPTTIFSANFKSAYTCIFWVKAGTYTSLEFSFYDGSVGINDYIILSGPGAISSPATGYGRVDSLSTTEWTKVAFTRKTWQGTQLRNYFYPGDRTSGTAGNNIYIWGVQVVAGENFYAPYVKTTGTAINTGNIRQPVQKLQNLYYYSNDVTGKGILTNGSIANDLTVTNPFGVNKSLKFTDSVDGSSLQHSVGQSAFLYPIDKNTKYNFSVFVKTGTITKVLFAPLNSGGNFHGYFFDLINNTFSPFVASIYVTNPRIESYPNGWKRISIDCISPQSNATFFNYGYLWLTTTMVSAGYQGDGTGYLNLCGYQITLGHGVKEYVETSANIINYDSLRGAVPHNQNILYYSEDLSQLAAPNWAVRSGVTTTPNQPGAPDGSSTATLINVSAGATAYLYQNCSVNLQIGDTVTFSVWLWAGTKSTIVIRVSNGDTSGGNFINISLPITPTLYSVTFKMTTPGTPYIGFDNRASFGGDTLGGTFYAWGAQASLTDYRLDYIKTTNLPINERFKMRQRLPKNQNLVIYSEQLDNAIWLKNVCTVIANNTTGPTGELNADRITSTSSGTYSYLRYIINNYDIYKLYTISAWVKKGTSRYCWLLGGNSNQFAIFDLQTGLFSAYVGTMFSQSNSIRPVADGYQISFTFMALTNTGSIGIGLTNSATVPNVSVSGETLYSTNLQFVKSNWADGYVQTTSAIVDNGLIRHLSI